MTWAVVYCTDGGTAKASEPAMTTVETEHELRLWVAEVEEERGISPRSIFDQTKYVSSETSHQWGTDYWWLSVTGEGEVQMGGYGEGLGTGLPNDHDYTDTELRMLAFIHEQPERGENYTYEITTLDPETGSQTCRRSDGKTWTRVRLAPYLTYSDWEEVPEHEVPMDR